MALFIKVSERRHLCIYRETNQCQFFIGKWQLESVSFSSLTYFENPRQILSWVNTGRSDHLSLNDRILRRSSCEPNPSPVFRACITNAPKPLMNSVGLSLNAGEFEYYIVPDVFSVHKVPRLLTSRLSGEIMV